MRKFKIKNRRKRKYVKKNDLAASYQSVQSLTIGLVPLLLMAVAFFTTVYMYTSPAVNVPALNVRNLLPEIQFTFELPALPKVSLPEAPKVTMPKVSIPEFSLPKVTLPEMTFPEVTIPKVSFPKLSFPKVTIPNPWPAIISFFSSMNDAIMQGFQTIGNGIAMGVNQTAYAIVSGTNAAGRFIGMIVQAIVSALQTGTMLIVRTIVSISIFIYQLTVFVITTLVSWITTVLQAIWNGLTAFVWFLGTPFRALHAYWIEISIALAPYVAFIQSSLQEASDGLAKGGESLVEGSAYFSTTVEHNQQSNK